MEWNVTRSRGGASRVQMALLVLVVSHLLLLPTLVSPGDESRRKTGEMLVGPAGNADTCYAREKRQLTGPGPWPQPPARASRPCIFLFHSHFLFLTASETRCPFLAAIEKKNVPLFKQAYFYF